MTTILQENFEYRHKKFDQSSRSRTDSSSSSGGDNEVYSYIKQEIEKVYQPVFIEDTSVINLSTQKRRNLKRANTDIEQKDFPLLTDTKRLRVDSISPSLKLPFSTALPVVVTDVSAVIPPTTAILPKISDDTIRNICKYHGNMVRKFPKKERTPKDQERRNKNTIACRMSRRVKKLEHIAIEEQYKEFSQQVYEITEKAIRATAYLQELIRLTNTNSTAVKEEYPSPSKKLVISPATSQEKKPFSISFLAGSK